MAKASYYATIPAPVRYCKEIEPHAKLLYAEITALSEQEGCCWATNAHFAELYDVDLRTIRRWLESLKKMKFIAIDADEKGDRRIWISPGIKKVFMEDKNVRGGGQKCPPSHIDINVYKENNSAANALSNFLLEKIKQQKPNFTKGVTPKWIKDAEKLLKLRTEPELKKIIDWIFNSSFWSTVILSMDSLVKNLDKIEIQMVKPVSGNSHVTEWRLKLASIVKNVPGVDMDETSIVFPGGNGYNPIKFSQPDAKVRILKALKDRKISTEGL